MSLQCVCARTCPFMEGRSGGGGGGEWGGVGVPPDTEEILNHRASAERAETDGGA